MKRNNMENMNTLVPKFEVNEVYESPKTTVVDMMFEGSILKASDEENNKVDDPMYGGEWSLF